MYYNKGSFNCTAHDRTMITDHNTISINLKLLSNLELCINCFSTTITTTPFDFQKLTPKTTH